MSIRRSIVFPLALGAIVGLAAPAAPAQDRPPAGTKHDAGPESKAGRRVGDPYPFDTCPVSGKKLGEMGDPVIKEYDGREVRYCCNSCPKRFEKDLGASLAKLDETIAADQRPLYPLKTSLVTGKDLPEKPFDFVYRNRLIRLGADSEKAEFLKGPGEQIEALNTAVIAAQGPTYPLKTCPVSGDDFGGDMGDPEDIVVAGRLIRLCCGHCKKDVEENPAKFITKIDEARKAEASDKRGADPK